MPPTAGRKRDETLVHRRVDGRVTPGDALYAHARARAAHGVDTPPVVFARVEQRHPASPGRERGSLSGPLLALPGFRADVEGQHALAAVRVGGLDPPLGAGPLPAR